VASASRSRAGRVLVIDDNEDARVLLEHLLIQKGYEVLSAASGQAAIETLKHCKVEVILLDVMMPGMDGFDVCRKLKQSPATASLPVILVTAKDDMETRAAGMRLGVSEFLAKPINEQDLYVRVQAQVEAQRRARELDRARKRASQLDQ
jgi:two-component system cell cycle response regulator